MLQLERLERPPGTQSLEEFFPQGHPLEDWGNRVVGVMERMMETHRLGLSVKTVTLDPQGADFILSKGGEDCRVSAVRLRKATEDIALALGFLSLDDEKNEDVDESLGGYRPYRGVEGMALKRVLDQDEYVLHLDPSRIPLIPEVGAWEPELREARQRGVHEILLGITEDRQPLTLDIRRNPLVLITGTQGVGKSRLMEAMAASIVLVSHDSEEKLFLVGGTFGRFRTIPGFEHFVTDGYDQDALEKLKMVAEEVNYRRYKGIRLPYMVVLIDDLDEIGRRNPGVVGLIERILTTGTGYGVSFVVSSKVDHQGIGGLLPEFTDKFKARAVGRVGSTPESFIATDLRGVGAERQGRNHFLLIRPSLEREYPDVTGFQAAYTSPETMQEVAKRNQTVYFFANRSL